MQARYQAALRPVRDGWVQRRARPRKRESHEDSEQIQPASQHGHGRRGVAMLRQQLEMMVNQGPGRQAKIKSLENAITANRRLVYFMA